MLVGVRSSEKFYTPSHTGMLLEIQKTERMMQCRMNQMWNGIYMCVLTYFPTYHSTVTFKWS